MVNSLLLITGQDIPFPECSTVIHQPKMDEIALIGEDVFLEGLEALLFKKNQSFLAQLDLSEYSNFNIIMSIFTSPDRGSKLYRQKIQSVLQLFFPNYISSLSRTKNGFELMFINRADNGEVVHSFAIKEDTYDILQEVFAATVPFDLLKNEEGETAQKDYNPAGEKARQLAEKLKKARSKVASQKKNNTSGSTKAGLFARYISILAVGQRKDINSYNKYTPYQIFNEYVRYSLKENYDLWVKGRLAGAQGQESPENWMKELHQ